MEDLDARIHRRSAELRERHPGVRDCRVSVADRVPHAYECRRYNVRLDIAVQGRELVINRESDDDPALALEAAFAAAHRQLDTLRG
jgi:hypothetical protein